MRKTLEKTIPNNYATCEHSDCPRAASCLCQIAYLPLREEAEILRVLNPGRCTKDEKCPFFRDSTPVIFARGFRGMQAKMLPGQYDKFMNFLIGQYNRTYYYQCRRGEMALSPKEQQVVRRALRYAGVSEPLEFDSYEESVNWHD